MKRRILLLALATVVIMLLSVATASQAQDYSRRNRRDVSADRYDNNRTKESVKRVDRLSGQLKNDVGRALDRSHLDGRSQEDRINDIVSDFHSAAAIFKDKFDSGSDPYRAENEARRVLDLGFQLDRMLQRSDLGGKVESKWSQVMSDLRVIENVYGYRSGYDYDYGRN